MIPLRILELQLPLAPFTSIKWWFCAGRGKPRRHEVIEPLLPNSHLLKQGYMPQREACYYPYLQCYQKFCLERKRPWKREFLIYFRGNCLHLQQSMEKFRPKDILKNRWGCGKRGIRRLVYLLDKYSSFPKRTGEEITERRHSGVRTNLKLRNSLFKGTQILLVQYMEQVITNGIFAFNRTISRV